MFHLLLKDFEKDRQSSQRGSTQKLSILLILTICFIALVVVLAWILSGWAAAVVVEPARRLSVGLTGLARGRFETWVSPAGAVHEMADLSDGLNRMSALTLKTVRRLERSKQDSATLASDAMRLFQQAVQAREPLTKHHPGLLEAYSKAVARQLGDREGDFGSVKSSVRCFKGDRKRDPSFLTRGICGVGVFSIGVTLTVPLGLGATEGCGILSPPEAGTFSSVPEIFFGCFFFIIYPLFSYLFSQSPVLISPSGCEGVSQK